MQEVLHSRLLFPSQRKVNNENHYLSSSSRVPAEEMLAISSSHPIYFSANFFSSLQRNTGRQNRCKRFFTSDFLSSWVPAEEKVARSSSHLIYFPADIFLFPAFRGTPGGEAGVRGSSHRISSRLGLRQKKRSQEVLHTLFIFPPIFSPAFRGTPGGETEGPAGSLHIGFPLVLGSGRRKGRKKFFTPYLFSRGCFLQPSEEHREAKPAPEVLHIGFPLVWVPAEEKVARSSHLIYFPADVFSSLQRTPGGETSARGSSQRTRIAYGRSEPVLPRFIAPYAGRGLGRTSGLVVGSVS